MPFVKIAVAASLLAVSACTSLGTGPGRSSVIGLHTDARGGAAAIGAMKAIEMNLDLVEPAFALQAKYYANRSGCMRIDVFNQGTYLQSEGVSSEGGWAVKAGDKMFAAQPAGGTETLMHGIQNPVRLVGLEEFPKLGNKLVFSGRESIESKPYDKFTALYVDGYSAEVFIDPTSHLIARIREHKPMHLAVDPKKLSIETQFSDYRSASGVMFPYFSREVDLQTGKELGHTTVKSIAINSADGLAACKRPVLPPR